MHRRVMVALSLAVLVGLAGCAGTLSDGTGTETSDEQALESETATVSSFSYPEGAEPSGITSVDTLLDEHESALEGTSVTLVGNHSFGVAAGNQSDDADFSYEVAHDPDSDRTLTTIEQGNGNLTAYVDGDTQYYRTVSENGTEYGTAAPDERVSDTGPESYTGRTLLRGILGSGEYNATDVVSRNGTELVVYELEELTSTPDNTFDFGVVSSADATVYVDSDGIVHEATMEITTGEGLSFTYNSNVQFEDVGSTTVEEPAWVDSANYRD